MKKIAIAIITSIALVLMACDKTTKSDPVSTTAVDVNAKPQEMVQSLTKAASVAAKTGGERDARFPLSALVDPNVAATAELAAIPGMTNELVAVITRARPFSSPSELNTVLLDSADEKSLHSIYRYLFIRVGLNTATEVDFELIPTSLSPQKLASEISRYRPYESMEKFNKEMYKSMSVDETKFLRRYVFID